MTNMTSEKVDTPIGYLEASITVDEDIPVNMLLFSKSSLKIIPEIGVRRDSIPVRLGESQLIPLLPGKYYVNAVFGNVSSEPTTIEIEQGKILTVEFYFGK